MSRSPKHKTAINKSTLRPPRLADYLYKIHGTALSNEKFRWGINIIEKYYPKYIFTHNEEYRLGLLYDHLAMGTKNRSLKTQYLNRALTIYKNILKRNPKYFLARYGIGRVYNVFGDTRKAIYYQVKSYNEMLRLPKKQRGAMAIGYLFEKTGDAGKAEQWYLREYRNCTRNNFGTTLNLLGFYKRVKNYNKALTYALKMEKLLKGEFKKRAYKSLGISNSKFVNFIKDEIRTVKSLAQKKEVHK